ncbi:hypothetical protein F4825DRAFT_188233 [Nemania diffusa]|nr:hypothetical protein F4825DRAFT_188233 [Nemania diffusa]
MGHSFGGIVMKEALCSSSKAAEIIDDTSGVLFLGTPHQGSPLSIFGFIIAWATSCLGSSTGLLFTLQHHSSQLSDLDLRFDDVRKNLKDAKIYSIPETKPSYILGCISLGLVVNQNSAKGPADKAIDVNTDHSGLNKCPERSGEPFDAIFIAIEEMRQRPSLLERGDKQIRDSYTKEKLNIERLSGFLLPMDQCYINLAIVRAGQPTDDFGRPGFRASLLDSLNIKEPDQDLHVNLSNLFEPRNIRGENEDRRPRRILIRGRPGVGKTTLCKKIVHDFIYCRQWNNYFTRLLWVPLRNLQGRQGRYKLTDLLHDEYFTQYKDPERILDELYHECKKPNAAGSLFLLDGLDEIWHHRSSDNHLDGIIQELLNQPNVIVTSRPSVQLLGDFKAFDIELETAGFYSEQVRHYVQWVTRLSADPGSPEGEERSRKILDFLDQHPLVADLVRIPIQLDALCFAWDDLSNKELQTMTDLYQAIEAGLWRKDARRLDLTSMNDLLPAELEVLVEDEAILLEKLAFTGLCNGLAVFDAKALSTLSRYLTMPRGKTIDQTLRNLSFLRSSGISLKDSSRSYYFLHLTLQEYFAARHLKRMWIEGKHFDLLKLPDAKKEKVHPNDFLHRHKYLENFDIVWRFMAGLLASDNNHVTRYFQVIQSQPLDLLGAAHHRLLMRCLFEIPPSNEKLRKQLEDQLSKWLTFETNFIHTGAEDSNGLLAKEIEFPIGLLSNLLQKGGDGLKVHLLQSINPHRIVSAEIVQLAVSWLENSSNRELVSQVLSRLPMFLKPLLSGHLQITQQKLENEDANVLTVSKSAPKNQINLLEAMLQAVLAKLEGNDPFVRVAAIQSVHKQSNLPEPILQAIAAKFKDNDSKVRNTAIDFFRDQLNIPEVILQVIVAMLENSDSSVRKAAISSLQNQSNLPESVLQTAVANLKGDDAFFATTLLQRQSNVPDAVLQAVVAMFGDENQKIRYTATEALRSLVHIPEILQAVVAMLGDEIIDVRCTAIDALKSQVHVPATFQAVIAMLGDESKEVRCTAIKALQSDIHVPEI